MTSTKESPFTLSYGTEVMAPAEIRELSWRVKHYDPASNAQGLWMNMDFIDEAREMAAARAAMYEARMAKAYNARVRLRNFQVRDLVLKKAKASSPIGKLDPKWEGPYKVMEIVNERSLQTATDGRKECFLHMERCQPQEVLHLEFIQEEELPPFCRFCSR
ncbi:UNVERIFIED_CONTAM: hypothetical protein Sradi_5762900 [Sesamum radiatum]|uniref:Uncharacterized protein n=1 Tax=Sesamum radiatum TaxID=300843 RepID=A0AAW2L2Y2_SESRA